MRIIYPELMQCRLSFREDLKERNLPDVLLEVIDGFFLIDIIFRFFIALKKPDGTLISSRKIIAITYFKYPLNFENKKINFQNQEGRLYWMWLLYFLINIFQEESLY